MTKKRKFKRAAHNPDCSAFDCGRLLVSQRVQESVSKKEVVAALRRHVSCDWGDISDRLWTKNDAALKEGGWLLSAYGGDGRRLMISTDLRRRRTVVRFPNDREAA